MKIAFRALAVGVAASVMTMSTFAEIGLVYGKRPLFVREFVDVCRAEGMRIGFYYSLPDWHHESWLS